MTRTGPNRTLVTLAAAFLLGSLALAQSNIRTVADRDSFTDEDRSRVVVTAEQQSSFGRTNAIVWRCDGSSRYELFIATDEFLTTSGPIPAVFRFDDQPAINGRWSDSTEGTAAFAPDARERAQFTSSALAAARVAVGLTDYAGTRHEYSFQLTGLGSALRDLGCVGADLALEPLYVRVPPAEAYQTIKDAVTGLAYTEDVNVMYFDGLTLRFGARGVGTDLTFTGTNAAIYDRIRAAFGR
jgi:hypothetical protein